MTAPDGIALLAALRDAARTAEGRRMVGELVAEVRRALDAAEDVDPVAAEATRLLARARTKSRSPSGEQRRNDDENE